MTKRQDIERILKQTEKVAVGIDNLKAAYNLNTPPLVDDIESHIDEACRALRLLTVQMK